MLHTIKKVEYIDRYRLKILFNNRQTKIVDLEEMLKKAKNLLLPLKDIEYFKQVEADGITLCWPNGVDLCPDVLFEIGKEIKSTSHKSKNNFLSGIEKTQTRVIAKSKH